MFDEERKNQSINEGQIIENTPTMDGAAEEAMSQAEAAKAEAAQQTEATAQQTEATTQQVEETAQQSGEPVVEQTVQPEELNSAEPNAVQSEAIQLNAAQSEADQPNAAQTETPHLNAVQSEANQPNVAQTEASQPTTPETTSFILVAPVQPDERESSTSSAEQPDSGSSVQQEDECGAQSENAAAPGYSSRKKPKKQKKQGSKYAKAISCSILCGIIIAAFVISSFAIGSKLSQTISTAQVATNAAKLTTTSSSADRDTVTTSGEEYTVAEIANACMSSVVAITNKSVSEVQTMFGVYEYESEGSGSGVIIAQSDTELLVVTNYHVVEGCDSLTVCFNDSEDAVYTAQVKGYDETNDLAVVSLDITTIDEEVLNSISVATIGDSSALEVGDGVVAIGNALGLGQSVTTGIISALDREVTIDSVTMTLLQTDAAINAGNSGGALFNMKGELIGINTAKFSSDSTSSSASIDNMGFAIPMATAMPIIEELMTQETRSKLDANYGCLNITGVDVSEEALSYYGMPQGVYVYSVTEGMAADNAGIQVGDIITNFAGTTIDSMTTLKERLQYYAAGETVEITVARNSGNAYEEITLTITLDNASEQTTTSTTTDSSTSSNSQSQQMPGSSQNGSGMW